MKKLTILAVSGFWPGNAFQYQIEAFAQLGHNVFRIGSVHPDHMGITWPDKDLPHPDILLPREAPLWNLEQFVDLCTDTIGTPDLLIASDETYRTEIIPTDKVPVVLISYDSWQNCFDRYDLFAPTVAYVTQPLGNRYEKRTKEDPRWRFLGPAYAPWVHVNKGRKRSLDFALFATPYGERLALCEGLNKAGFVTLYGQVETDHYVNFYNSALCTLHNPGYSEVKWRFCEAAAMGCVNISWYTPLFDRLGYVENVHYAHIDAPEDGVNLDPWPSLEDLIDAVLVLKNKPDFWQYLSRNAQELTEERHSYFHRVEQILGDLQSMGAL